MNNQLVQETRAQKFFHKVSEIHSGKYDYSKTVYLGSDKPIEVICPIHGSFSLRATTHLRQGCPACSGFRLTTAEFIKRASIVHKGIYSYDKAIYKTAQDDIEIKCPEHGYFLQNANAHLQGHGCPNCAQARVHSKRRSTTETWIKKAKAVHGSRYDYSKVQYVHATSKIEIICKKHGSFFQEPSNHLSGQGCPHCRLSKGEQDIRLYLLNEGVPFSEQKKFIDCKSKRALPFDFFIAERFLLEYDGIQHFEPVSFNTKQEENHAQFLALQARDRIKTEYCKKKTIPLYRITYKEDTQARLQEILKQEGLL